MMYLQNEYGIAGELIKKSRGETLDIDPNNVKEWILYLFIARILRLCDQKATSH